MVMKPQLPMKKHPGILSNDDIKLLEKSYTSGPAAFGNEITLHKQTKLPYAKIRAYLQQTNSYTKYRKPQRKFRRLKVIALRINEIWSIDLAFVDKLAKYNKGMKYLLVAVDVLSRYVRVQPMKNKTAASTVEAFKKMLKSGKQPEKIWSDKGTEFQGVFGSFCRKKNIEMYSTNSETKSCFAERNIRSLKNLIYRYLEHKWTWIYLPKLQDFVKTINTRVNRVTKLAPAKVTKKDVPFLISLTVPKTRIKKPKYNIGQVVRISQREMIFKKGYKQTFTDELFTISAVATLNPVTYTLTDQLGGKILGKFYQKEITPVTL